MEKENGVWRTIRGRRIFIASGESLGEAMAKSGKFKREDIRESKHELKLDSKQNKFNKADNNRFYKSKQSPDEKDLKYKNARGKRYAEAHKFYYAKEDINQAEKNRINENAPINKDAKTRVERNKERYSETDRRGLRHEELKKRLDAEKLYNKNRELYHKHGGFYNKENNEETNNAWKEWLSNREKARKLQDNANNEDTRKLIREYQAKKQSNNKIDNKQFEVSELKQKALERLPKEDIDTHESDLYIKKTKESEALISNMKDKDSGLLSTFKDQQTGETWYEIPFANMSDDFKEKQSNNKVETEKELYERAKNNPDSIDPMTENSTDWEALEKKYGKQETFTQHTDMYGGTREYTKEDLKRMEEAGIKPMKHSYTGGGWEGVNSNLHLDTKEQAKRITDAVKNKYPDVKVARKTNLFSGGSSIDFNIMSSDKDLFVSDKDIDKMGYEDLHSVSSSNGFEWWAKDNIPNYDNNAGFTIEDLRKYAKQSLAQSKKSDIQGVQGNEWYLSDYGKKVVSDLNKEANSYTYNDSDGMVDYFDHGTYMHISIGKWDKPYQVNDVKAKVDAYKKRKGK